MTKRISCINKGRGGRRICRKQQPKQVHKVVAAHDDDNVVVEEEDRISDLPDDILLSIISRLTTRDATATSILSSRWQPLHTRGPRLLFFPEDLSSYFDKEKESLMDRNFFIKYMESLVREKFRKHMKRVNRTLDSYEGGQTLNELRIHMHHIEGPDIQSWLEFGLSREVQILDIRMINCGGVGPRDTYYLQLENLLMKSCIVQGLKSLRELSLRFVEVNDLEIKLLVSNCPNLESLSIECANLLRHISIVGHPKLQHLNLTHVSCVESIEIENMLNLVSLRFFYFRQWASNYVVRLNNLPKLIELDTNDDSRHFLSKLPSWICNQLMVSRVSTKGTFTKLDTFSNLKSVKHLELEFKESSWERQQGYEACALVDALLACKFLETLQLKSVWRQRVSVEVTLGVRDRVHVYSKWFKVSQKLHKVKLSGYVGMPGELEFAVFIIQHCAGLKELIVEPCRASKLIRQVAIGNLWEQLGPIIPDSLNLVVI